MYFKIQLSSISEDTSWCIGWFLTFFFFTVQGLTVYLAHLSPPHSSTFGRAIHYQDRHIVCMTAISHNNKPLLGHWQRKLVKCVDALFSQIGLGHLITHLVTLWVEVM